MMKHIAICFPSLHLEFSLLKIEVVKDIMSALKHRSLPLKGWMISTPETTETRVWKEYDREGNVCWSAYNPVTRQSVYGISETEMRIWIERR